MKENTHADNVVHLHPNKPSGDMKERALNLAKELIATHTQDARPELRQFTVGDNNLQLSSSPVIQQRIKGNGNIQISISGADDSRVLAASLKKKIADLLDQKKQKRRQHC